MVRFLVDTGADYEMSDLREQGIQNVSMKIQVGGKEYKDGVELGKNQFYELLTTSEEFPKTSQPSPQDFVEIFEDVKEKGDEMICVLIASKLSGTYQSGVLAKSIVDYDKIHIIDTKSVTVANKIMADYGKKLADEGKSFEEIVEELEGLVGKIKILAGLDTLEYLYKGGRLSKTAAAIGETVKIKPIIYITAEGEVGIAKKCLGKNRAVMDIKKIFMEEELDERFPLYSIYNYGTENTEGLEKKLADAGYTVDGMHQIGASIGAHVGPGAFGVVYVVK